MRYFDKEKQKLVARINRIRGQITEWADYHGGLTSRRTALAAHFTEWIEY